jgi:hypothetical protein
VNEDPQIAGIVISGGTVGIGALAQGPHARASYNIEQPPAEQLSGDQRENLSNLMLALLDSLGQHKTELRDQTAIQAMADEVSAELDQNHPDKSRVSRLLTAIASAVGPVTEIATAVTAMLKAVGAIP